MLNDMVYRGSSEQTMEYLGYVRGYDKTVRRLQRPERQLAFAMGHHPHLGEQSALTRFSPDELKMILELSDIDRVPLDPLNTSGSVQMNMSD